MLDTGVPVEVKVATFVSTMVLHLSSRGLTVIFTVSTVLFTACTTLASGNCFSDRTLTDWGHMYVIF